jgi:phage I-like protein
LGQYRLGVAKKLIRHSVGAAIDANATDPLPTEFQICKAGLNRSYAGDFIFDANSAAKVLAEYAANSADGMIDLQHYSLPDEEYALNTNEQHDAMGWFTPQVRSDGSLWAVNVRWSAEGERRLRMKLQRYISPVVLVNTDTREVVGLWNLALVSQPAMNDAAPLVAASKRRGTLRITMAAHARAMQFLEKRKGQKHGSQSAR